MGAKRPIAMEAEAEAETEAEERRVREEVEVRVGQSGGGEDKLGREGFGSQPLLDVSWW